MGNPHSPGPLDIRINEAQGLAMLLRAAADDPDHCEPGDLRRAAFLLDFLCGALMEACEMLDIRKAVADRAPVVQGKLFDPGGGPGPYGGDS